MYSPSIFRIKCSLYTVSSENFGVTIVIRQYLQCVIFICWDIYGEHIKYFCKNAVLATSVHELLKDREGPVKSRIAVQACLCAIKDKSCSFTKPYGFLVYFNKSFAAQVAIQQIFSSTITEGGKGIEEGVREQVKRGERNMLYWLAFSVLFCLCCVSDIS